MTTTPSKTSSGIARSPSAWAMLAAILIAALLAGTALSFDAVVLEDDPTDGEIQWFGHLVSALALLAIAALMSLAKVGFGRATIGADGRLSTSRLQAVLWTVALAWALLSLIVADWAGAEAGLEALLDEGLKEEYLVLLGGPFAGALAAQAIVGSKVESGEIVKTASGDPAPGVGGRLREAVGDDNGDTSLYDSQYLLFNAIALVYFVGTFIDEAGDGLPQIPELLVGLTSVAAATYVSRKAVERSAPVLTSVVPPARPVGQSVTIHGSNLLPPRTEAGAQLAAGDVGVLFGDVLVQPPALDFAITPAGTHRLTCDVPAGAGATVRVVNVAGAQSNELDFRVLAS